MHAFIHTYTHTYTHIYIYTHMHTYIHTYIYTYLYMSVCMSIYLSTWSGQVRSKSLTCTFRLSLGHRYWLFCLGQGEKGGTACTGRCRGVPADRPGSVAGGGCYGDMEFGKSRRIKPKDNVCAFQMNQTGRNFVRSDEREKK